VHAVRSKLVGNMGSVEVSIAEKLNEVGVSSSHRARFGESIVKNAVHCTDLPEDGEMECRYFFETLASL